MKKQIARWSLRIGFSCLFILGLLAGIALSPVFLYANSTTDNNYTIYHQQPLHPLFITELNNANDILKSSELYDPLLKLSICLNDGSLYPTVMRMIRGEAFGWGFENKVVLMGNINVPGNYAEINGYKWNLTALIAHEAVHCLQFHRYGLFHTPPIVRIPEWKFEGYPEYIARKNNGDIAKNIGLLLAAENTVTDNWINFEDGTGTPIPYYRNRLLVAYCIDIKRLTYAQLLSDTTTAETVSKEMMEWYSAGHF